MLASQREKMIALVLLAVLGLLVVDQYLFTPYLDQRAKVQNELDLATQKQQNAQRLLENRIRVNRAWNDLLAGGLKTDPAAAESQTLHAMRDWAQSSRVDLQSLKPDRIGRTGDFQQIRIQATGNATTAAFANLLSQIETATIPVKVNELRLTSRKEGNDDLAFAMSVSTIVFSPAPEKPSSGRAVPKGAVK